MSIVSFQREVARASVSEYLLPKCYVWTDTLNSFRFKELIEKKNNNIFRNSYFRILWPSRNAFIDQLKR